MKILRAINRAKKRREEEKTKQEKERIFINKVISRRLKSLEGLSPRTLLSEAIPYCETEDGKVFRTSFCCELPPSIKREILSTLKSIKNKEKIETTSFFIRKIVVCKNTYAFITFKRPIPEWGCGEWEYSVLMGIGPRGGIKNCV